MDGLNGPFDSLWNQPDLTLQTTESKPGPSQPPKMSSSYGKSRDKSPTKYV